MANDLSAILPTLRASLDKVSRERVGFIQAVWRNPTDGLPQNLPVSRAALNQTVTVPVWGQGTTADNTPATEVPDTGDQTAGNVDVKITKSKHYPVRWNDEETLSLQNQGIFESSNRQRIEQGFRTLTNEMETDIWTAMYPEASRAIGTAGTTPFATADDMSDFAGVLDVLEANGAPDDEDLHLVLGLAAMKNLRAKQSQLFKANEAGTDELLRRGIVTDVMGLKLHKSAAVGTHTAGTGASYLLNSTTTAVGTTTIPVDTGSGTILAGDVITFAGTTDQYVVKTALSGGNLVIQEPGLLVAETNDDAITVKAASVRNMGFHRTACVLLTRLPASSNKDKAIDKTVMVDDKSGIAWEIALYPGYLQNTIHIRAAWGVKVIAPRHIVTLLG